MLLSCPGPLGQNGIVRELISWMRGVCLAWLLAGSLPALAEPVDILARITQRGYVNIGYSETAPPFSARGPQGPIGFSLDLCAVITERIRLALTRRDLRVRFVPVAFDQYNRAVQVGVVDLLCASMADTPQRRETMAFSPPVFISTIKLLTHVSRPYTTLSDLRGQVVVVLGRTPPDGIMQAYSHDNALDLQVVRALNTEEALAKLRLGQAAAWARNEILLRGALADLPDAADFRLLPTPIAPQQVAIAFGQDRALQALVEATFAQLVASGRFAEFHEKWMDRPNPLAPRGLGLPLSPELREAHIGLRP